jgi:hypothetical protein
MIVRRVKVIYSNIVSSDIKPESDRKDNIINISLDGSMLSDISQNSRNYILKHRSPDESIKVKEKPNLLD